MLAGSASINRSLGDNVRFANDKLFVNNEVYTWDSVKNDKLRLRSPRPDDHAALTPVPTTSSPRWRGGSFTGKFKLININARILVNKTVGLECLLLDHNPNVAVVTETCLSNAILDLELCSRRDVDLFGNISLLTKVGSRWSWVSD